MIHETLTQSIVLTKRDLYYRDPALFENQETVDRYVDSIARTFGVTRSLLNISATAKGLVVGAFTLQRGDGTSIEGCSSRSGILITALAPEDTIEMSMVRWILVVEKDATFRALVESPFWAEISQEGMLISAKGYPDILTRQFLHLASTPSPTRPNPPPVYGLFDYDPDGLAILNTYKYSSANLQHESAVNGAATGQLIALECSSMRWLGVRSSALQPAITGDQHGLLPLTPRDRRKATLMLNREPFCQGGSEPEWRRELQKMLMLNIKAEIQILEEREGGLSEWLMEQELGDLGFESLFEDEVT
ncbi:DNA topoisomerase IV, alpha subunit [Microthyrium microscopicum]|uniref:DNA topoisomerase (ATP-hydrolyzing) n=1 Tax=Microthyrium microscopicum TaxID=703497 RepID=A0A6A6UNI2_9PEZI|nr:DNA topoisomerase IV, alpha subunit [Microthyrium microscopicum]